MTGFDLPTKLLLDAWIERVTDSSNSLLAECLSELIEELSLPSLLDADPPKEHLLIHHHVSEARSTAQRILLAIKSETHNPDSTLYAYKAQHPDKFESLEQRINELRDAVLKCTQTHKDKILGGTALGFGPISVSLSAIASIAELSFGAITRTTRLNLVYFTWLMSELSDNLGKLTKTSGLLLPVVNYSLSQNVKLVRSAGGRVLSAAFELIDAKSIALKDTPRQRGSTSSRRAPTSETRAAGIVIRNSVLISLDGNSIALDEPSLVALRNIGGKQRVEAVGRKAERQLAVLEGPHQSTTPLHAGFPIKDSVIADAQFATEMLRQFLEGANAAGRLHAVAAIPTRSRQLDRKIFSDCLLGAGCASVRLVETPLASAIGAGVNIETDGAAFVVQIGDRAEISLISGGGIVQSKTVLDHHVDFEGYLYTYFRRHHNLNISSVVARRIIRNHGNTGLNSELYNLGQFEVMGRDLMQGVPREVTISEEEISKALAEPVGAIIDAIKDVIFESPPSLASDISENGLILTGTGALLKGLQAEIRDHTGLPVAIAKMPEYCDIFGAYLLGTRDLGRSVQ